MGDFNTFSEWQTIRGQKLDSRAEAVLTVVARKLPLFRLPVKLYDMWMALPGELPSASHVTPTWLGAELLPYMYILDIVDGGQDFRWRLFGTAHAARYGSEATGMLMSEAARRDKSAAGSLHFARQTCAEKRPTFFLTEFLQGEFAVKSNATVVLPLAGPDGDMSRLFGCSVWS
ncbi:MAG: hypothetical protein EP335_14075 [Alphaproteobacteria bacterium]|nr:MAG: hypothetical protein EP335_14075 [Alphaproteobacteria bacterium]